MTDNSRQPSIDPLESGIIVKQLVIIIVGLGSIAGFVFSPEQVVEISAIAGATLTIGLSLWTIHNRINKPCPPINSTKTGEPK